ncbi:Mut7-C RNAse domain-containing protein [Oceanimonas sp. CHS3-5]|uniref:Mut7-C RNAse domain-containing protein n=1 Tax=Oceanimonas sp. CHS3-5 TaxID=3068186 RepID=UPI00273FD115|nr:Mut7-C RNAse domain-containing protein [Oceanimonas sp. CHS3-5]MDP5291115.1 Mut7-C RNAse domain-containing protein [Oceanimonas sp. CHS3-5]
MRSSQFRFYGQLNDFLPPALRQRTVCYRYSGSPGLRDAIQSQGVPHTEVELVLVDGVALGFDFNLSGGERVSVYPRFKAFELQAGRLGPAPLTVPRFILDVHLGKLCRYLRLLGFDTAYGNDFEDSHIIDRSLAERRIILTRDLGILKQVRVQYGYFIRATDPDCQIEEVLQAFELMARCRPLSRCINCNGEVEQVAKSQVASRLPDGTRRSYQLFYQCRTCGQVYWRGAHYARLMQKLARLRLSP